MLAGAVLRGAGEWRDRKEGGDVFA